MVALVAFSELEYHGRAPPLSFSGGIVFIGFAAATGCARGNTVWARWGGDDQNWLEAKIVEDWYWDTTYREINAKAEKQGRLDDVVNLKTLVVEFVFNRGACRISGNTDKCKLRYDEVRL